MKILVTGGGGQLATVLKDATEDHIDEYVFFNKKQFDITDLGGLRSFRGLENFDFIINAAAYTNVDGAEKNRVVADAVNHLGVKNLAKAVAGTKTRIIQISTDYVFSGENHRPYLEDDSPNPISYYGETKLAGEKAILGGAKNGIIIRTSWLYSYSGMNFVKKMCKLIRKRSGEGLPIEVVSDQIGAPTSAESLCRFLTQRIANGDFKSKNPEIYHFTDSGVASWYDLANALGVSEDCKIWPTTTENYPTPAKRPHYSVLSLEKIRKEFGVIPWHWRGVLSDLLEFYGEELFEE
jgi:dTDP-4-dehydrorhamnose reductase